MSSFSLSIYQNIVPLNEMEVILSVKTGLVLHEDYVVVTSIFEQMHPSKGELRG